MGHYHLHGDDSLDKSLATHGFHRDDITDVLLTHLHFDHCGGSIVREGDKLVPAFKNATYWSNEGHWNWAVHPNDREKASFLKENILPIKFKPLLIKGTIFEGGEKMTVWVSDDGNRIPVRIESPISVGSIKVDMIYNRNLRHQLTSLISLR